MPRKSIPRWVKISLKIAGGLLLLLVVLLVGLSIYVSGHKTKILSQVTADLNKNLNGKLNVGGLETSFFNNFPNFSVTLLQVSLRDAQWARHHQTLLDAKKMDVAINVAALIKGDISVHHIDISQANINLFTDSTGYSNTSVFKKGDSKKEAKSKNSSSSAQLGQFSLENVTFTIDDRRAKKLFKFAITELQSKMKYSDNGWHADMDLNLVVNSLAFSTVHGSFVKNKTIKGELSAEYQKKSGSIQVTSSDFNIGGDRFGLNAHFALAKQPGFNFYFTADKLLWSHSAELVAANIAKKFNMFNMDKPMAVTAIIAGSFSGGGDPYLYITADVKNTKLTVPGSTVTDCSFKGVFTNNYVKGKKLGDENSVIRLAHFTGKYDHLPFTIDTASIINLIKPIAVGNFRSAFPVANLNYLTGSFARFGKGTAAIQVKFDADIVDYQINKPILEGSINVKNADINYLPSKLQFKNTSMSINFVNNNLVINNTRLQVGKSIVTLQASVNNFLNLYYNAPEKIILNLQVNTPQLYLGEFMGLLAGKQAAKAISRGTAGGKTGIDRFRNFMTKAKISVALRAANIHYFKFLATNATANLVLSYDGLELNNVGLKTSGGSLKLNAAVVHHASQSNFKLSTNITNVDIHSFFYAFDNFGLKGITYQNLKGLLSSNVQLSGLTNNEGGIVPGSSSGTVTLTLKNGALLNYQPLISVGKFAFPFRDLHHIMIPALNAKFDIQGKKIIINPFQLSSSVLNADIAGVYASPGTDITLDVPLRDPKNDSEITDQKERAKKRNKGIVMHLRAKDNESGKLKIGLNKDHKLF